MGATALVSTALFASDNLSLKLKDSSTSVESIDTLAIMLGLITLMCIGAAILASVFNVMEEALTLLYPHTSLLKLFVHSSTTWS